MKSKSDDNMNNNIYNNYRITDDKYENKKKLEKIKKKLNINNNTNNISNISASNQNIKNILDGGSPQKTSNVVLKVNIN